MKLEKVIINEKEAASMKVYLLNCSECLNTFYIRVKRIEVGRFVFLETAVAKNNPLLDL